MELWLKGLAAAALAGVASAAGAIVIDPQHFNSGDLKHVGIVAGMGALMGVLGYFKQSPVPPPTK